MLISLNWMRDFVDYQLDIPPDQFAATISLAVAEVDDTTVTGDALRQVTVAEVLETAPHPNADRLKIATINDGSTERRIVCGAPNCAAGIKVPLADIGAQLPTGDSDGPDVFTIRKAVIRGVESSGMLCSADELGVPGGHDGLLILPESSPVGTCVADLPEFSASGDVLLEIDNKSLTHRPDLWGHYGFARELAAIAQLPLKPYPEQRTDTDVPSAFSVDNRVPEQCRRYCGLHIENVQVGPSPKWLSDRLTALGQNSINNIVDITNYILLELGQPMHAFDVAKLDDKTVTVRRANEGETFIALDERRYSLTTTDIVIDDNGNAVALAGVMGGLETGVDASATAIFLESANFDAASVRRTSARLGLRSESSSRFEKSLDPENCERAIWRAWQLISSLCPDAQIVGGMVDDYPRPFPAITIDTSYDFLRRRLGHDVSDDFMRTTLQSLGFMLNETEGSVKIDVPSWRRTKDVAIAEDIVEEVGRLYGYDNIPPRAPAFPLAVPAGNPERDLERQLKTVLVNGYGCAEIMAYPWVGPRLLERFGLPADSCLKLSNALSEEHSLMRPHAVPQLILAIAENLKHADGLRLFEYGRLYDTSEMDGLLPRERRCVVGAIVPSGTSGVLNDTAFYETKALVLDLLRTGGIPTPKVVPATPEACSSWVHPGVAADFKRGNITVAKLYKLHPTTAESTDILHNVYIFEIDADILASARRQIQYRPISKFPKVFFELTVIADDREVTGNIVDVIRRAGGKQLVDINVLTVYQGEAIASDKKAVSFRLSFAADHTLNSDEITALQDNVVDAVVAAGYPLKE